MVPLYDSTICRLCAGDNGNEHLFVREEGGSDLCSLVNRYLPLKVQDDGKLPKTICPGCNIQLEATVEFFDLVVTGQHKLRTLFKYQNEQQRKAERLRNKSENAELAREDANNDSLQQNEEFEQQIIVQILPDGSMYAAEHEMSLQMEGLTKPRRKRGRPPKALAEAESLVTKENATETASQGEEDKQEEEIDEVDGDGRRRRKRKVPKRFSEAVQGKELERIFKEEGVIGEEDYDDSDMLDDSEDLLNISAQDEVIGHLETEEGKDLGEVVISHRGKARSRSKSHRRKPRFICHVCGRGFLQRSKYIIHKKVFHKDFVDAKDNPETQSTTQQSSNLAEGNVAESQEPSGTVETQNVVEQDASAAVTDDATKNLGDAIYRCDRCEKQFESKQECEVHQRMEHDQQKLYTCNVCDKTFVNQSNLKIHMGSHEKTKPVYSCDVCDKVLNHPSSIVYHKEAEHNDGRRFVCNKCNKGFKHRQLLQRHQLVHSNDRPHTCKSCNACFKTKANLINHQATHTGQKKHFCEICSQQFAHKTSLTLHYRWHNGQKPYECKVCHKSFSQNGNLQEHMRIHTGEKPYCCDYCGRKFTTSSQFKLHVKRHTGERPWKCEFCVKTFLHKDTWKCHVRRHKGERPFQCTECNRGFTEQWALRKHVRSHTGEKPYSCKICGKAFADCSNLAKHKKVHKAKEVDASENSQIGEVWQIMPNSQENDEQALDGQMTQVIATDETSTDGVQQIIYVAYRDPDETNPSRTLHFVDASMIKNKSEETPSAISLPQLTETEEDLPDGSKVVNNATSNDNEQQSEVEPNLHLQITHDDDGNPISLSVQETRQLVSQGHLISQLSDGQFVRVHPGMFTQFQALNIHIDEDDVAAESGTAAREPNAVKEIEGMSTIQADAEAIVQALEDENTDATMVATINQLQSGEQPGIADGQHSSIEFLTADGQKIRVLSSYPIDPMQLTSEYLTIM
ncbi:zinc finger protein 3-like [Pseudomyrmex gracilis]|uniref:zinc finger protein 3-like n=1 Tax=Pseudomyrmex gracilis TaxID=219809 RepID=UPI000994A939|nr:zinc finger protein 3-like [Pseudomyrmex gracilis]